MNLNPHKLKRNEKNSRLSRNLVFNGVQKTKTSRHVKGKINSMERETQSISLHINSIFRDDYYTTAPSDFQYTLPINCENITSMRLTSVTLPSSWYLFSAEKGNNTFFIELFNWSEDTKGENGKNIIDKIKKTEENTHIFEIIIPDGNYNRTGLESFLNKNYFYLSQPPTNAKNDNYKLLQNIQCVINPETLKTEFHIIERNLLAKWWGMNLIFVNDAQNNLVNSAGWILGFRNAKYLNIVKKVQSESLFDSGGDRYLYFCLDDYTLNKTNNNIICLDNTFLDTNVLAKINIGINSFGIQVEDQPDTEVTHTKTRNYNGLVNLKKIHIKLLDMFGNLINLNAMDFSFTLELEKLYQNIL
jgi:hypothetical protein